MRRQTVPGGPHFYSTSLVEVHSTHHLMNKPRLSASPEERPLFPEYEGKVGKGATMRVVDASIIFQTADDATIRRRLMFEDGWGV